MKRAEQAVPLTANEPFFVGIDGRQLECAWFHPPQGSPVPPLVMLHEGLGSVAMWKDFPALLAASTGRRVLAYSRFGHGRSDPVRGHRDPMRVHETEALGVLSTLLDELEIERPVLFGHSDGASIALIHAGSSGRAVSGVIVLAPHVMVEPMCLQRIRAARIAYESTDLKEKLGRYHAQPDAAFWGWNDLWLAPGFAAWNIEDHQRAISCPILAIQGYQDEYGTMEQLDRIAAAHPNASLLKLDNCAHSPHRDQPAAVLLATSRFVQELH